MQLSEQIENSELCWFCRKNAEDAGVRAILGLHKNHTVDIMIFCWRHRWEQLKLSVPRCTLCFAVHRKAKRLGILISWILAITSLLLSIMFMAIISDFLNSEKLGFLPFVCLFVSLGGFFLGRWIGQDIVHSSAPDVKPIKYGYTYHSIDLQLKQGWKTGIPLE